MLTLTCRLRRFSLMTLVKTCAAIMALALFLQSGCDLWCQRAEQMASAKQLADGAVPPCHHPADSKPDSKDSSKHESHKGCVHPQAADDNGNLQAKVAKANQPVALVVSVENPELRYSRELAPRVAFLTHIALSPPPPATLRI